MSEDKSIVDEAAHETGVNDHRFLDEAGDTTFYGKGRNVIIGQQGVSLAFAIYMKNNIRLVVDLYDAVNYEGSRNYYRKDRPLTAGNKISPPSS